MRRTGIEVVGDVPWGTHFCQFYETGQDLIDVLVPYFAEGLSANEYCMWVTSAPLDVDAAKAALRASVPDLDERLARGQIDILDHRDWYLRSGKFSADEVLQGWIARLAAARERGFEGLRLTGNIFWLEASDWQGFTRYEEAVNDVIGQYRMLALCTYSLAKCRTTEILDVVANHEFALVKRSGRWECIASSGQSRTEIALRDTEERIRRHNAVLLAINRIFREALTCETEEQLGRVCLAVAEELTLSQFGFIGEVDAQGQLNDIAISDPGWEACRIPSATGHTKAPATLKLHGVYGRVVLDGKGFFTNNPVPHSDAIATSQGQPPLTAFLGAPLVHGGECIGMIGLANRQGGYRDEDLEALEALAPVVVHALMHRRAERALADSQRRLSLIVDSIADGFFALDRQWRFTRVNDAALGHFHKTRDEMLGRTLLDVFPFAKGTAFETAYRAAMESGEPSRFESTSMVSDRTLEVHAYPGREHLTVLFRDVTERKKAEAALHDALDRAAWLGRFPEENRNPVLRVAADAKVLYRNPAATRVPGWACAVGETAPQPLLPLVARALADRRDLHEDVAAAGRIYSVSVMPFHEDAYANVYGIDITERRQAEEALQKAHDELEQRVRERTEELRHVNETLRMISDCNQVLVRATTEDDLVREICRTIHDRGGYRMAWVGYADDDEARTVRPVASVGAEDGYLEHAHITWADEERGRGPTGTCIRTQAPCFGRDFLTDPEMVPWRTEALKRGFRSSIALPLVAGGRAFGALTIYSEKVGVFDEPQSKLLAELADDLAFGIVALRARRDAEERAHQLRALATELGQVEERERRRLAAVLHDHLQQLLVGAKYNLASVAGRPGPKAKQAAVQEVVQILDSAIGVTSSLTAELSPPTLHEHGLVAGLEWLARQMKQKHGLRVDVRADATAEPAAESVRIFLYQAARELLFNVVKHAGVKRASIRVVRLDDGQVQVTVADSGAGFEPERLAVGEPGGGGFGLFSIRERLGYFGGHMSVESAPGRGSRFTLVAPALLPEAPPTEPPAAAQPQATQPLPTVNHPARGTSPKIRVLLADDHAVMREGLARLLGEQPDIEIVGEAADGQTAIEMARQLRPDIVLMDVSMPRANGLTATRQLALDLPTTRVIGLSMHDDAATGDTMREAGAAAYVAKSAPPAEVLTAIRACAAPATPVDDRGSKPVPRPTATSADNRRRSAARRRTAGTRQRKTRSK
jgi:PAS domain S-box-containing protein